MVVLSHFLTARAEIMLCTNPLACSVLVQSGNVFSETSLAMVNSVATLCETVAEKLTEVEQSFTHQQVYGGEADPGEEVVMLGDSPADGANKPDGVAASADENQAADDTPNISTPNESRPISPGPTASRRTESPAPNSTIERFSRKVASMSAAPGKPGAISAAPRTSEIYILNAGGVNIPSQQVHENDFSRQTVARRNFDHCASEDIVHTYYSLIHDVAKYLDNSPSSSANHEEPLPSLLRALNARYGITHDPNTDNLHASKHFAAPNNQYISTQHGKTKFRAHSIVTSFLCVPFVHIRSGIYSRRIAAHSPIGGKR
jgi:hypothetical protein